MGWIRDFFQDYRIDKAKSQSGSNLIKTRTNAGDIDYLDEKLERLSLVTHAMWELLQAKGYSEAELKQKMIELDMRDGVRDGKVSRSELSCRSCGKPLRDRRSNCYWCGAPVEPGGLLE